MIARVCIRGFHRTATEFVTFGDRRIDPLRGSRGFACLIRGFHRTATEFITFGEIAFITFGENELIRFADRGGFAVCSVGFTARLPNLSPSVKSHLSPSVNSN